MPEPIHDESCGCSEWRRGLPCSCARLGIEVRPKPAQEPTYPCEKCGRLRTKAEGGTTFTVCDECWGGRGSEVRTMVMSWRVKHYRVNGLEVFPAFDSHIYDPVVMLQCAHCLKAYGPEKIATIPRHRESLEAEIEALKAERDEWRDKAGLHQIASEAHKAKADRLEFYVGSLTEQNRILGEVYAETKASVARLEGVIVADHDTYLDFASCCGREASHAEARAIKARHGA